MWIELTGKCPLDIQHLTSHLPIPGHENVVSVSIAPAKRLPNINPIIVTTGISAFLRA